jgi:hypothetical protein
MNTIALPKEFADSQLKLTKSEETKKFDALWKRILKDTQRYDLEPFVLKGFWGEMKDQPIDGVANCTAPDAAIFADYMMTILNLTEPVIDIKWRGGKAPDNDAIPNLQLFWKWVWDETKKRKRGFGKFGLHQTAVYQTIVPGWANSRIVLVNSESDDMGAKAGLWPDFNILDASTVVWRTGTRKDGFEYLKFVSVQEERDGENIKEEFPSAKVEAGTKYKFRDIWTYNEGKVVELIFVEDTFIEARDWSSQGIKKLPFSVTPVMKKPQATGRKFEDMGGSVFTNCSPMFDEESVALTLLKTATIGSVSPALALNSKDGLATMKYPTPGQVIPLSIDKGEAITAVNQAQQQIILQLAQSYYNIIDNKRQLGTITDLAMGQQGVGESGMTASLFDRRTAQTTKVIEPHKQALAVMYCEDFYIVFGQFINMTGVSIELDTPTGPKKLTPAMLKEYDGKFDVEFFINGTEPIGDAVKLQRAQTMSQIPSIPNSEILKVLGYDVEEVSDEVTEMETRRLEPRLYWLDRVEALQKEMERLSPKDTTTRLMHDSELQISKAAGESLVKEIAGGQNEGLR